MMFAPQTNKAIQLNKLLRRDNTIMFKSAMKCDLRALDPRSYMTDVRELSSGSMVKKKEKGIMMEDVSITVF